MIETNHGRHQWIMPVSTANEKAFAYKMKLDAIRRKAGRPSADNSDQVDLNFNNKQSRDIIAED